MPQSVRTHKTVENNPFKTWPGKVNLADDLNELESSFFQSQPFAVSYPPTSSKQSETPSVIDITALEELAKRISQKLLETIETQNLIVDRAKLEELKIDNQLMAKHIYSLLQKRGIQEKQLAHLQHEQSVLKHLFWRFYYRQK